MSGDELDPNARIIRQVGAPDDLEEAALEALKWFARIGITMLNTVKLCAEVNVDNPRDVLLTLTTRLEQIGAQTEAVDLIAWMVDPPGRTAAYRRLVATLPDHAQRCRVLAEWGEHVEDGD